MEALSYITSDRQHALAQGVALPEHTQGAALFADIAGFTPLTEALAKEFGPQRGAEEISRYLNRIYNALIHELHAYGGSVITFGGDAITCWLAGDDGQRAVTCALAMQAAMRPLAHVTTPSGLQVTLAMKVAVVAGSVRRFVVGDPTIQLLDVIAGATLDQLAETEHHTRRGEVAVDAPTAQALGTALAVSEWRTDAAGRRYAVVAGLTPLAPPHPWPPAPALTADQLHPWLLPAVQKRLHSGQGEFLAELRPVVVAFVRFEGINYDHDPQAGAKLNDYVCAAQRALHQFGGTLLQLSLGDKGSHFYASFGAPTAHEDDAIRAATTALLWRDLADQRDYISAVQVGLSQGRVYTGAYGGAARRTYGVLGDAVNLAARLMQAAAPNQILATQAVHQDAATEFDWHDLPPIQVKGKSAPIAIFQLDQRAQRHAEHSRLPTYALPMVGRAHERALIAEKIQLARQGQGQVMAIMAEAGMGKSRLVAEAMHLAAEAQFAVYFGECQSYGQNTSYLVWHDILRGLFGVNPETPLADTLLILENRLAQVDPDLLPRIPLLGVALNLPLPENDLTRSLDAKLRKNALESLVVACARAWAQTQPVLMVLEDCHWLDALSYDLLLELARASLNASIGLLLAYRPPDPSQPALLQLEALPHRTNIRLNEFTPAEATQLIQLKLAQAFGPHAETAPALIERLVARADGNPFYIEELLNYLRDRNIAPTDEAALAALDLPTSLHSLILSRIDQLTEQQKLTLKIASIVGRLFRAAVLWGAYPQLGDAQKIRADLESLSRLELTLVEGETELTYLFKHIVTQEVAYESLPYATRAILHGQIGHYLERVFHDTLDQWVDLLAFHFERSDHEAKKRLYLLRAGEAAQANYANRAAISYYHKALPLLEPAGQVSVLRKLGQVFELLGEWPEAEKHYTRALHLAEEHRETQAAAWCRTHLGELARKQGRYAEAQTWLSAARHHFEALGDEVGLGRALHFNGTLAAVQGHNDDARVLYEHSLRLWRQLNERTHLANSLNNLGILARRRGDYGLARELGEECLALRRTLNDRWGIAYSLNNLGNVGLSQSDYAYARACFEEALVIQRQIGDRWAIANLLTDLGRVVRDQGDLPAARTLLRESLKHNRDLNDRVALAYVLEALAWLSALENQPTQALRLAGAAAALRQAIGSPLPAADQARLEQALQPARDQLGPEADPIFAAGYALPLETALAEAAR